MKSPLSGESGGVPGREGSGKTIAAQDPPRVKKTKNNWALKGKPIPGELGEERRERSRSPKKGMGSQFWRGCHRLEEKRGRGISGKERVECRQHYNWKSADRAPLCLAKVAGKGGGGSRESVRLRRGGVKQARVKKLQKERKLKKAGGVDRSGEKNTNKSSWDLKTGRFGGPRVVPAPRCPGPSTELRQW